MIRGAARASLNCDNRIACKVGNPIVLSYYTTKENCIMKDVKGWEYPKVCVNLQTDVR